jgi:DNA-binding CsgD family transcriptional regulator/Tfp pilus assembly protein PilF
VVHESVLELVATGRSALRRGDPAGARDAYRRALEIETSGTVLAGLAEAAYLEHDHDAAIDGFERAYAAFRDSEEPTGAARIAGTLGYLHGMIRGDRAVMGGWIARAQTLLEGTDETVEAGWVEQFKGMFAGPAAERELHFNAAVGLARRYGARDLELDALAYLGATLVHDDRVDEGMVHLDEALAGVSGREVDDFLVLAEVFCQLFSACEHAHDVGRADEWIRVGESIAARRRLPDVSAFCRTHYGGLLTTAGRWPEADTALTGAVRLWAIGPKGQREAALIRLAQLRLRQGRFEDAEQLLSGVDRGSVEAAATVAALHHVRGEDELAVEVVERALSGTGTSAAAAPLLVLLTDLHLAAGDVGAARVAARQLHACAERHGRPHLFAAAALAQGRVCLATGEGDAFACLHTALAEFARGQLPFEMACTRLELAAALAGDRPEVAMAEGRAALAAFEALDASSHAHAAAAFLRSLGARTASPRSTGALLSTREAEVLELLGHGLSNPEISERLYISRKTVEHHVGNVLAKLGLRGRAEAAAYAARHEPRPE